jgi:hypothetical protein
MLEGASLAQIAPHLLFLSLFSAAALGLAALLFKWE